MPFNALGVFTLLVPFLVSAVAALVQYGLERLRAPGSIPEDAASLARRVIEWLVGRSLGAERVVGLDGVKTELRAAGTGEAFATLGVANEGLEAGVLSAFREVASAPRLYQSAGFTEAQAGALRSIPDDALRVMIAETVQAWNGSRSPDVVAGSREARYVGAAQYEGADDVWRPLADEAAVERLRAAWPEFQVAPVTPEEGGGSGTTRRARRA